MYDEYVNLAHDYAGFGDSLELAFRDLIRQRPLPYPPQLTPWEQEWVLNPVEDAPDTDETVLSLAERDREYWFQEYTRLYLTPKTKSTFYRRAPCSRKLTKIKIKLAGLKAEMAERKRIEARSLMSYPDVMGALACRIAELEIETELTERIARG